MVARRLFGVPRSDINGVESPEIGTDSQTLRVPLRRPSEVQRCDTKQLYENRHLEVWRYASRLRAYIAACLCLIPHAGAICPVSPPTDCLISFGAPTAVKDTAEQIPHGWMFRTQRCSAVKSGVLPLLKSGVTAILCACVRSTDCLCTGSTI